MELDASRSPKRRKLNGVDHQLLASDNASLAAFSTTASSPAAAQDHAVCYGMLDDIAVTSQADAFSTQPAQTVLVVWDEPNILRRPGEEQVYGTIPQRYAEVLLALREVDCSTQLFCQCATENGTTNTWYARENSWCTLCVIIYGPSSFGDEIGSWLDSNHLFLQDPVNCDRNVPYRNPHLLSAEGEELVYTFALEAHAPHVEAEVLDTQPDLLEILNGEHFLEETETPAALATPLFSHQKTALTFMLQREQGLRYDDPGKDAWSGEITKSGEISYINSVTGERRSSRPPDFMAGLLADQMGLGKSLSIISLIVANPCLDVGIGSSVLDNRLTSVKTSLLVVPFPLIHTWNSQLSRHLHPNRLKWCVFHGRQKPEIKDLCDYDIVITTYKTVSLQWKVHKNSQPSIFALLWHRIILDEAHIIQNRAATISKSVCALHAQRRWAVTGTPIQNKLTDLASLFEFLQIYPYSNPRVFERDILRRWQQNDEQGFLRVKTLVNFVTLFRPKSIIHLPKRYDEVHHLEFSPGERNLYQQVKSRGREALNHTNDGQISQKSGYVNVLEWLNQLRLVCNHGVMHTKKAPKFSNSSWTANKAQATFKSMLGAGNAICANCASNLAEATLEDVDANTTELPCPKLSKCLHLTCGSCISEMSVFCGCVDGIQCQSYEVTFNSKTPLPPRCPKTLPKMAPAETPTKISALIASLKSFKIGEKSVVFSFWTYTLDLVESALQTASITYTRVDGDIPARKRTEAIRKFQEDPNFHVVLVSITCGGAGLDLTAGSVVYLLEPQWNPMMEEQALCRVHRMGQTREVTTIRYRMKDSFEDQVVEIQERKRDLAALTLSNKKISEDDIGAARLQYLRAALD